MSDSSIQTLKEQKDKSTFYDLIMGHKTEDQIYKSYFEKTLWTIDEFSALMIGITPEKYEQLLREDIQNLSFEDFRKNQDVILKDFEKLKAANKIYERFMNRLKKDFSLIEFHSIDKRLTLSPWKFIKWIAMNSIPVKKKFFNELPLYLVEIYIEFQPINVAVRKEPKWHRNYHRALYLQHAGKVIEESKRKMTPEDIYNHPHMEWVRRTFKNINGKQVTYTKRTIKESWLSKIYPKKRGRPRKLLKKQSS